MRFLQAFSFPLFTKDLTERATGPRASRCHRTLFPLPLALEGGSLSPLHTTISALRTIVPFLLLSANITAADLTVTVNVKDVQPRMNGPIPVPMSLNWDGSALLEGRLEATLLRRKTALSVVNSPPLFLSKGSRTTVLTLPPPPGIVNGDSLDLTVRFVGTARTWDVGTFPLGSIQLGGSKELVLCLAQLAPSPTEFRIERERRLGLEANLPRVRFDLPGTVTTRRTSLKPDEFSINPAAYCAYDAVFLDGPAFARLGEKQLTALLRWVRAGGSLAVSTGDIATPVLNERHLVFLKRLLAKSDFTPTLSDGGQLALASRNGTVATALAAPELGRLVVIAALETTYELDGPVWRSAMTWLWKARYSCFDESDLLDNAEGNVRFDASREQWVERAAAGFAPLAPDAPRQIPFAVLSSILACLLLLVAPGEWIVLGKLRRRRWTWIVFPMLCAGCAWWVSSLASRYVGFRDRHGTLRIVDIATDGRVLRDVRFQQLLPSKDHVWPHDVRDGMAVALERSSDDGGGEFHENNTLVETDWISADRQIMRRALRQWTPGLVRVTTFPDTEEDSGIDWKAAQVSGAQAVKGSTGIKMLGDWSVANSEGIGHMGGSDPLDYRPPNAVAQSDFSETQSIATTLVRIPLVSNYDLISRHSPALGGHYADLATHSPTEHEFIAAWRRTGHELVIYRRYIRRAAGNSQNYRDQ